MQKIISNSFKILKNNMLFIQPLMLYILLSITILSFIVQKKIYIVPQLIILIAIILLTFAFLAGWLYINKLAVEDFNEDDDFEVIAAKTVKNFKMFFEGVGKNFFKTLFGGLIYFVIFAVFMYGVYYLCMKYFGYPAFIEKISTLYSANDKDSIINSINLISDTDKIIIVKWFFTFMFSAAILNFLGVLYFAVLNFNEYNIFSALFKTLKTFILNIYDCIIMMLVLFLLYVLINFISMFLGTGTLGFVIFIILLTMYLNYYVLLIFCYYNEKTKINSNNGTERVG